MSILQLDDTAHTPQVLIPFHSGKVLLLKLVYLLCRCLAGSHENITTVPVPGEILEFMDTSEDLQPYTQYKYSITAQNSEGVLQSSWSVVRTVETAPEDLDPPTAEVISAYSVLLNWTAPARPRGIIRQYLIMYQESTSDPTSATFSGSTVTVPVSFVLIVCH